MEKGIPKSPLDSPQAGPFGEAAEFVRELVRQGKMTREEALRLTEEAYQASMRSQLNGIPVEHGEHVGEWPPTQQNNGQK